MNITEFAAYAGVSKAAVSRYFNGGYLSVEKRERIAAAVEATGYHPSIQAQMLRTRRARQVLVILPKLSSESCARMVEGISDVLDQNGYHLLLVNTANDSAKEIAALHLLQQNTVDGVILMATIFTPEHRAILASLRLPSTSPYRRKILSRASSLPVFTMSAAVVLASLFILMSRGASYLNENPRSAVSNWWDDTPRSARMPSIPPLYPS